MQSSEQKKAVVWPRYGKEEKQRQGKRGIIYANAVKLGFLKE